MTYAIITQDMKQADRAAFDERLEELYLEDFPAGLERERERARRMAREMGIDDSAARGAMGMATG